MSNLFANIIAFLVGILLIETLGFMGLLITIAVASIIVVNDVHSS